MKSILTLVASLVLFSVPALAAEQVVPAHSSKQLFDALVSAFPEAHSGFNYSESVGLEPFWCQSNQDEYVCAGKTLEGQDLILEGGSPIPAEESPNKRLDGLWQAMKRARLPILSGEDFSGVSLKRIFCVHDAPSSGGDLYSCEYEK